MSNMTSLKGIKELPYIIANDGIIVELSQAFIEMTEFQTEDFLNKTIENIFEFLRVGPGVSYENIDDTADYFLFTKSFEVRFVNIRIIRGIKENVYIFLEKPNSNLDIKFPLASALCVGNYSGTGIYSMPDMTLLRANDKYINFFDEPFNKKENCIGKHISEFIPGFKGSTYKDIWNTVLKTGISYNLEEYKYEGFNRGITYWKSSLVPIYEDSKIKYCVVMAEEITEQVLHREKIQEQAKVIEQQNNRLKWQLGLLDLSREAIFAWELDGGIVYWNKGAERKYGYSSEEALGCVSHELLKTVHPGNFENIKLAMLNNGLWNGEVEHTRKDGTKLIIETYHQIITDENGHQIVLETNRDISKRKIMAKELKHQKEQLEAIIESMSDGLELVSTDTKITFLNQSAKDFFYNPNAKVNAGDSLKYNKYYYGIDGAEIPREDLPAFRVLNKGSFQNYILTIDRPDKKIYASINGSPINNGTDTIKEAVLSIRDITEQIKQVKAIEYHQRAALQAEREKREALEKAMEMKDEFLSLISHEFRTPLNVINTAIQALNYLCGNELSDRSKKYINTIRQNTFRQLRLVNNLLDIIRADAGRIKVCKKNIDVVFLTNSIVESVSTYSSQKGVTITFVSSVEKKIIGMDDEKYERILLNLLSNAIKFTPEGKLIEVKLRAVKNEIRIEVKDNGIGIPKNKLDVIFERFGQVDSSLSRQAEGAGIGLSLVKRFVDALGGSISVKSKEGKGTTFTILLPDEKVFEETDASSMADLLDNRLVQVATVEFSDIYL